MLILDYIYKVNTRLRASNTIWDKLQIKRSIGLFVKFMANNVVPLFINNSTQSLYIGDQLPIIVSLTSFPSRIKRVWITIESILCQTHKPKSIILWLSRDQFPNEISDLPKNLIEQQGRGLIIRFVDGDIRSYKKFYYSFLEFKQSLVLTLDDDLMLPSYFLKSIYDCKVEHPNNVIASFGFRYKWDPSINYIRPLSSKINPGDTGNNLFFGSGGGTLFDTSFIIKMESIEKILELCPTADDIFLNALIRRCGCGVTFHMNNPLLSIKSKNNVTLVSHNGDIGDPHSRNAIQLRRIVSYYESHYHKNPFM